MDHLVFLFFFFRILLFLIYFIRPKVYFWKKFYMLYNCFQNKTFVIFFYKLQFSKFSVCPLFFFFINFWKRISFYAKNLLSSIILEILNFFYRFLGILGIFHVFLIFKRFKDLQFFYDIICNFLKIKIYPYSKLFSKLEFFEFSIFFKIIIFFWYQNIQNEMIFVFVEYLKIVIKHDI